MGIKIGIVILILVVRIIGNIYKVTQKCHSEMRLVIRQLERRSS